jgi:hypothetical protein
MQVGGWAVLRVLCAILAPFAVKRFGSRVRRYSLVHTFQEGVDKKTVHREDAKARRTTSACEARSTKDSAVIVMWRSSGRRVRTFIPRWARSNPSRPSLLASWRLRGKGRWRTGKIRSLVCLLLPNARRFTFARPGLAWEGVLRRAGWAKESKTYRRWEGPQK